MSGATLILVNGLYAAGKTTLASWLAQDLRAPLFTKDQFKERLFELDPPVDREHSRRLGAMAYDLMYEAAESVLASGATTIVEAPLNPAYEQKRLETVIARHGAQALQLFLDGDREVLIERYLMRRGTSARHPGHDVGFDTKALIGAIREGWEPLGGVTTLRIDATAPAAIDRPFVLEWVTQRLGTRNGVAL